MPPLPVLVATSAGVLLGILLTFFLVVTNPLSPLGVILVIIALTASEVFVYLVILRLRPIDRLR